MLHQFIYQYFQMYFDSTFGRSCDSVKSALANQMRTWATADNCANGGEKCLYHYKSETSTTLVGVHETPVKHYLDDMTFTFTPTSDTTCSAEVRVLHHLQAIANRHFNLFSKFLKILAFFVTGLVELLIS